MGLSWKSYHEGNFAKTSHGYYVTYQKFDNETKTHRAATEEGAAAAVNLLLLFVGIRNAWDAVTLPRIYQEA